MSYKYTEEVPPDERPAKPVKRYYKKSLAEEIVDEFIGRKTDFVRIAFSKVRKAKNAPKGTRGYTEPGFAARAIGRVLTSKKLENIEVWSDDKNIYMEKAA